MSKPTGRRRGRPRKHPEIAPQPAAPAAAEAVDQVDMVRAFERGEERKRRRDARLAQSPQEFSEVAQAAGGLRRDSLLIDVANVDPGAERRKFLDKSRLPSLHAQGCDVAEIGADCVRKVLYAPPTYRPPAPTPAPLHEVGAQQQLAELRRTVSAVSGANLKPSFEGERLAEIRKTQAAISRSMTDTLEADEASDMSVEAQLARRLKAAQDAVKALQEAMKAASQ
jgi:hypothetical protein